MMIALHKNARTTPAIRSEIAASTDSVVALAQRYGISEETARKWKKRTSVHDASHTPHRLQTTLTPAQEHVVVELRRTLLLPLDDLLAVTREFICAEATRSGLDRCLRRHGAGNLNALKPAQPAPASKTFKAYEPGYLHVDLKYLPQMQDESSRRYLFVAIDRATRWVFVQIKKNKTAASAKAFLNAVHKACPMRIQKVLTDNGKEFTDRLFASRARQPTGEHEFDQLCASLGIEHRLTKPRTPRTNGMVERFNGRIADVLRSHRFHSAEDLEQTLLRYVALYNHQFPQSALKSRTPLQAMKDWYAKRPDLFVKRPYDHPGCDNYPLLPPHLRRRRRPRRPANRRSLQRQCPRRRFPARLATASEDPARAATDRRVPVARPAARRRGRVALRGRGRPHPPSIAKAPVRKGFLDPRYRLCGGGWAAEQGACAVSGGAAGRAGPRGQARAAGQRQFSR